MPIFNYLAVFRRIHKKRVHLAVIILMPISRGWAQNPKYGMHPDSYNLDTTVLHEWSGDVYFQSQTEKLIKEWLDEATLKTDQLVDQYWEQISKVAQALLEEEVLSEAQFKSLIE